jgi:Domain of unknown function (DUF5666)
MDFPCSRWTTLLGLVVALLTAILLPAAADRGGHGGRGDGRGQQPTVPAGSVSVRATLTAVDATAGTLQLTDRNGLSVTLKTTASTVIQRDGQTATLAALKVNDTVLAVYDRTTLVASRIVATSPPPTVLTGTITALDTAAGTIQVTTDHGTAITLTTNASTQFRLNGSATTAASLAVGQRVQVTYRPAEKIALTVAAATPRAGVVSGAITALDLTAGTLQLTPLVGAAQSLTLNAQTEYRLNGRRVAPSAVAVGQLASVQVGTGNVATIVAAQTPPLIDLLGTISALDVQGGTVQVTTPALTTITLRLGSFTTVQRNNAASTVEQLAIGDQVQVRYEYLLIPNTSRALRIIATSGTPTTPTPTPSTGPVVASVTLSPAAVTGGTASTATVTLSAAAPTGGAVVTLTSSNPTVATVPANVTVEAGAISASFPVTTTAVTAATPVTLTASFGGASSTAVLTVNP